MGASLTKLRSKGRLNKRNETTGYLTPRGLGCSCVHEAPATEYTIDNNDDFTYDTLPGSDEQDDNHPPTEALYVSVEDFQFGDYNHPPPENVYVSVPDLQFGDDNQPPPENVYVSVPDLQFGSRGGCRSSQSSAKSEDSGVDAMCPIHHVPLKKKISSTECRDIHCTCDSNCMEENMNKYVEFMVKVFRPLICETIRADEVSGHLYFIDSTMIKSRNDPDELLTLIEGSQEPGKWRTFLDALRHTENEFIFKLITGRTEQDHSNNRRVLRLFTEELKRNIKISDLVDYLYEKGVINELDKQNIEAENTNKGEIKATDMLLDRITRRCLDWTRIFVDGLRVSKHPEMANTLQEFLVSEKESNETDTNNSCSTDNTYVKTRPPALPSRNSEAGKNNEASASASSGVNLTASASQAAIIRFKNRRAPSPELDSELRNLPLPCNGTRTRSVRVQIREVPEVRRRDGRFFEVPAQSSIGETLVPNDKDDNDEIHADFNADYKRWVYVTERIDVLLKELNELHTEKEILDVKHRFSSQVVDRYIPILRPAHMPESIYEDYESSPYRDPSSDTIDNPYINSVIVESSRL